MLHSHIKFENQDFKKDFTRKGIEEFTYKLLVAFILKNPRLRVESEDNDRSQQPPTMTTSDWPGWRIESCTCRKAGGTRRG